MEEAGVGGEQPPQERRSAAEAIENWVPAQAAPGPGEGTILLLQLNASLCHLDRVSFLLM